MQSSKDLGDGVYTDGNGNYYLDIDYDGDIDLETIAPSYKEDDYEDEGPPPIIDDNKDDNTDGVPENEEQEAVNQKAQVIIQNLGNQIGTVKVGLSVSVGTPQGSPFGGFSFSTRDIFEKTKNYTIVIAPGLSEVQKELVMAHEFMHLKLFQISQDAGSPSELGRSNPELYGIINMFYADKDNNPYWLNDAHHFYMGQHVEEMEQLLRDAFPGRDDDFYECGKWGGGALNSDAFEKLSEEERGRVIDYLSEIGLYF